MKPSAPVTRTVFPFRVISRVYSAVSGLFLARNGIIAPVIENCQAVVLAGGLGSRLRPFTQIIPKPLLPVGDRSVLEIQIAHLRESGISEIFLATGYKSPLFTSYFGDGSRFGVRLRYSFEEKPLGTAGPLGLLKGDLRGPFIVLNGDILTNLDFGRAVAFHEGHGCWFTVVAKEVVFPLSYGSLVREGERVVAMHEKPDLRVEVMAGIYVLSAEALDLIPPNERFGMDQLVQTFLDRGLPVGCYRMQEYWLDIGRMEDYEKAVAHYDGLQKGSPPA
jgi:NDP-sugar pyrophosphorylase family protein